MAGRIGRSVYAAREWALLRLAKLRAENWRCDAVTRIIAREVLHLVPLHAGGPALPGIDGTRVLCQRVPLWGSSDR